MLLRLILSIISEDSYYKDLPDFKITFYNCSDDRIKILDMFDPVPVFFSFHIIKENGTILNIPQAGKMELSPVPLKYKVLSPNQYWSIKINLRGWIQDFLFPGLYHVTVNYHNQYGEDCYHGTLLSNEIKIKIV